MTQPTGTHDQPKIQLTVQPPQPVAKVQDTSPERIMAYRHQIGFTGTAPHVYGYFQNLPVSGPLSALSQAYFDLSLEKDGLLVLGLDLHSQFTGKNGFIPFAEMTRVQVKNHGLTYFLITETTSGKLKATVTKFIWRQPWQRTNTRIIVEHLTKLRSFSDKHPALKSK